MIFKSILVINLLSIVVVSSIVIDKSIEEDYGYESYDGPPAPLNPDGSVAFTKEYERIRDEHLAAHAKEWESIKAELDEIEKESASGNSNNDDQHLEGHYDPEVYERVPYVSAEEDDGQYDPARHEEKYKEQYDDGKYRPKHPKQDEAEYDDYNDYSDAPSSEDASYETDDK